MKLIHKILIGTTLALVAIPAVASAALTPVQVMRDTVLQFIRPISLTDGLQLPGVASSTTGCLSIASDGWVSAVGFPCSSGGNSFAFPFTAVSYGNATSTTLGFLNGFISTASSTINAPLRLSNLSLGNLGIGTGGLVYSFATSTATDFAYPFPNNSTSTQLTFNGGMNIPNDTGVNFGPGAFGCTNSTGLKTGSDGTFLFDAGCSIKFKGGSGLTWGYTDGSFNYVFRSDSLGNTTQSGVMTVSGAASSTFTGGIDAARICLTGTTTCLGATGGSATGSDFTYANTYGALNAATSSNVWFQGAVNASTTIRLKNNLLSGNSIGFFDLQRDAQSAGNGYTLMRIKAPTGASEEATLSLLTDFDANNAGVNERFVDFYNEHYIGSSEQSGIRVFATGNATLPNSFVFGFKNDAISKDAGNVMAIYPYGGTLIGGPATSTAPASAQTLLTVSSTTAANLLNVAAGTASSRLIVKNDGKVGLGTTSPSDSLTVSVSNNQGIRVSSPNAAFLDLGQGNGDRWRIENNFTGTGLLEFLYNAGNGNAPATNLLTLTGTGSAIAGRVGIGTTSPGSVLSIGNTNGINFSTATSTFSSTGGVNLTSGCYAIRGVCVGNVSGGSGTNFFTNVSLNTYLNTGTNLQAPRFEATSTTASIFPYASTTAITIQSFTLATSTTVCTRGEQCQYQTDGTDDQVQIQAAIDAVKAYGGGEVFIKHGLYNIASRINIQDAVNIQLRGEGAGTILKPTGADEQTIKASSTMNVSIKDLAIDGANMSQAAFNSNMGVAIKNSRNVTVSGVTVKNSYGYAAFIWSDGPTTTADIILTGNNFACNALQDCIGGGPDQLSNGLSTTTRVIIQNNVISQRSFAGAVQHSNADLNCIDMVAVQNIIFDNNICNGNIVWGSEQTPNQYSRITNNIVDAPFGPESIAGDIVVITSGTSHGTLPGNLTISDNTVRAGKINVTGAGTNVVTGLVVNDNDVTSAPSSYQTYNGVTAHGIYLDTVSGATVSDNNITSTSTANSTTGVKLVNTTNSVVSGGTIKNHSVGVDGGSGSGNRIFPIAFTSVATELAAITNILTMDASGEVGVATTSPGSIFSIGSVANFRSATSTFYSTGGINLTNGGCFAVAGVCIGAGGGGGSGTVGSGLQNQLPFYNANGTTLTATSSLTLSQAGYFGVGTSSANEQVLVYNPTAPILKIQSEDNGLSSLRFGEVMDYRGGFFKYDGSINTMQIGVHEAFDTNVGNDTVAINIPRISGFVGVGTTTPFGKLSVQGTAGSTAPIFVVASSSNQTYFNVGSTGTTTIAGPIAATSTQYMYSTAAGKGAAIILEDTDGAGCTEVSALNGVLAAKIVTCPTEI